MTVGGIGDRYAGFIHLGDGARGARLYGALYYNGRRSYPGLYPYYAYGNYYRYYRPIDYYGWDYYRPWYGYTYASAYFDVPHVYRFYDTDVYYVDRVVEQRDVSAVPSTSDVGVPAAAPTTSGTYPTLTEPGDSTLIGQGNAAFRAGRYADARRLYVSVMLADERDGYAKLLYTLANFALGDYAVAGLAVRRALLTTPALIDYPVDMRSLYEDPLVLEAQIADLMRHVTADPNDTGASLLLAYIHYATGQPDRALPLLDRLTQADAGDDLAALLRDAVLLVTREGRPRG